MLKVCHDCSRIWYIIKTSFKRGQGPLNRYMNDDRYAEDQPKIQRMDKGEVKYCPYCGK
ncbi:hypothetical protein PAJ34TS1_42970 [Paenibacillus azoreducens]|uniref:Uncharacterized protein n=1 Tax=Paenibacillus azoreducens TaxID=116718 RepID=A0A919YG09_9BACL|nr:hypothetical protein J34TS1_45490 [Paenibacillus azoreducens]